jgi:hypothetical protein
LPHYVLQLGLLPLRENRIFLRDDTGTQIDRDTDGNGFTAAVSAVAGSSGQWSVAVLVRSGSNVKYDILVNSTSAPKTDAPRVQVGQL